MYNETQKRAFIEQYTVSIDRRKVCVRTFNATEPFETAAGADICTFRSDKLTPVLDEITGMRTDSKKTRISVLRAYAAWCLERGVPGANLDIATARSTGLNKFLTGTVRNPAHLQRYLDAVYAPEEEKTVDNTLRLTCWMTYAGIAPDDTLFTITNREVDLSYMVFRLDGEEYPIYREALPCLRNCLDLTQFTVISPNRVYTLDRAQDPSILRWSKAVPDITAFRYRMSAATANAVKAGETELRLSPYKIWLSGLFYRMYESELAGMPVDFRDVAYRVSNGKVYKLDTGGNTQEAARRKIAKNYSNDYEKWKETLLL